MLPRRGSPVSTRANGVSRSNNKFTHTALPASSSPYFQARCRARTRAALQQPIGPEGWKRSNNRLGELRAEELPRTRAAISTGPLLLTQDAVVIWLSNK